MNSMAKADTTTMVQVEELTDNAEIADGFGEVANMIAGNFKNAWVEDGKTMDLAIPSVSFGSEITLAVGGKGGSEDYAIQLDVFHSFGRFAPFVTAAYRFVGDSDEFELDNTWGIEGYGVKIVERVPLEIKPNERNLEYLRTKKEKLGHVLHLMS